MTPEVLEPFFTPNILGDGKPTCRSGWGGPGEELAVGVGGAQTLGRQAQGRDGPGGKGCVGPGETRITSSWAAGGQQRMACPAPRAGNTVTGRAGTQFPCPVRWRTGRGTERPRLGPWPPGLQRPFPRSHGRSCAGNEDEAEE